MILADPAATEALGARLAGLARPGDVITLEGPLGAGKTSIARGLLAALGLPGEAPSPSFAIVQPYEPPEVRFPVLHVDLYRIDDPAEIDELAPTAASQIMADLAKDVTAQGTAADSVRKETIAQSLSHAAREPPRRLVRGLPGGRLSHRERQTRAPARGAHEGP